ncbi:hypothetical protein I6A84_28785 [Frankia sp. CNm7]|uniref:Uncharacterized protein n=1 Tax=Frankia nepalensis TaxID=1836974 RepID=A0A937UQS5_9ACTN|nr:hypothetical protein [Frankia nepalensis]MBL7499856.1 hypothetical protein [Frankia nepalensis]MBL7515944.1 hypothetical protein [Frankia nepalensis]MBL7521970.1 hypothetical protein [Frankia nepalensis]MBL7628560.1 hypothetical protein [Frankia nepalensis]
MRTFDLDAFDAYDEPDRPGEHILPWEMWERDRPWRADTPDPARTAVAPRERKPAAPDGPPDGRPRA